MCPLANYGELDVHIKYLIHPYEKWFILTKYMNVFGFYVHIHIHNLEEASSRHLSATLIVISTGICSWKVYEILIKFLQNLNYVWQ